MLFLFCLSAGSAQAEPEYFTWIDAEGRIHNTLKSDADRKKNDRSKAGENERPSSSSSDDNYLTEDEFAAEQERLQREQPPFYTWIDAEGRLRYETIPQPSEEAQAAAADDVLVSDHTLLPGWRVSDAVRNSGCCGLYQAYFQEELKPFKPVLFSRVDLSAPLRTQTGERPAWYFRLSELSPDAEDPVLRLRLRDTDAPLALIALDAQLQPLHFIPQVERQLTDATWKAVAFYESLISIADKDVQAFILYFPAGAPARANLEVEYRP
ncbi:hypothetical protein [Venatoribacter cucullus]|uniref:hypothetical protein n=1 Tax=Venatoribacter cucullus TaxID=2661630 RepID=UPI00223ECBD4|nr:hypothetical protein [Venatoribacter cucullus]UZK03663.1 hypothetical protein GAY96_07015 [Venatoribacter cucullus]